MKHFIVTFLFLFAASVSADAQFLKNLETAIKNAAGNQTTQQKATAGKAEKSTKKSAAPESAMPLFTNDGWGRIKLGMNASNLPNKLPGYYDLLDCSSFDMGGSCDTGYLNGNKGDVMFETSENEIILNVCVTYTGVRCSNGIYVGMPLANLKKIRGLKRATDGTSNYVVGRIMVLVDETKVIGLAVNAL